MSDEISSEREVLEPTRVQHAISMATGVVVHLLSKPENLLIILQQVWVDPELDRFEVYRDSKRVPGRYSREIYRLSKRERLVKDPRKYFSLPVLPEGAREYLIGDMRGSASCSLDESHLQKFIEDSTQHELVEPQ